VHGNRCSISPLGSIVQLHHVINARTASTHHGELWRANRGQQPPCISKMLH